MSTTSEGPTFHFVPDTVWLRGFPDNVSKEELTAKISSVIAPIESVDFGGRAVKFAIVKLKDLTTGQFLALSKKHESLYDGMPLAVKPYRDYHHIPQSALKDDVCDSPDATYVKFTGVTRIVRSPAAVKMACEQLTNAKVIGFDTERKPSFKKGEPERLPALLQLSTSTHAFLFPLADGIAWQPVCQLLSNEKVLKVGVHIDNDVEGLMGRFVDLKPNGFLRLEELAQKAGSSARGLRTLARDLLDVSVGKPKRVTLSNWEAPKLSTEQIEYAATDAWIGIMLFMELIKRLQLRVEDVQPSSNVPRNPRRSDDDRSSSSSDTGTHNNHNNNNNNNRLSSGSGSGLRSPRNASNNSSRHNSGSGVRSPRGAGAGGGGSAKRGNTRNGSGRRKSGNDTRGDGDAERVRSPPGGFKNQQQGGRYSFDNHQQTQRNSNTAGHGRSSFDEVGLRKKRNIISPPPYAEAQKDVAARKRAQGFRALTQKRISTSDVPPVNPDVIEALTRHSLDVPPPPPDDDDENQPPVEPPDDDELPDEPLGETQPPEEPDDEENEAEAEGALPALPTQ